MLYAAKALSSLVKLQANKQGLKIADYRFAYFQDVLALHRKISNEL